ncbi:MAG: hypothetical protein LBN04_11990 [Oscillospiraceae bacterium]|nr:hypothetical protein [Oscillospiraceae bacterium]
MKALMQPLRWLAALWKAVRQARTRLNERMQAHPPNRVLPLPACALMLLMMTIMLFVPSYLGLSNDGSFDIPMRDVGLKRLTPDDDSTYFSYYERTYQITTPARGTAETPLLIRLMLRAAILLDTFFTKDSLFDVRWLAFLYLLPYIAAMYPILRFALKRVSVFSEGVLVAALGVLMFADVSYTVRLTAFTSQPMEMILLTGMVGLLFRITQSERMSASLILFGLLAAAFSSVNHYFALGGFVLAGLCLAMIGLRRQSTWKVSCLLLALLISLISIESLMRVQENQTDVDKYHAMTRGVLMQSQNPEDTLADFGISPRYSILADTYADQNYPVTQVSNELLQQEFLAQYDTLDISTYYMTHPGALLNMLDIGVKASFVTRSDFSGNYERSVGLPARAKSPFMGFWSTFKTRSAPRTLGFFLILSFLLLFLYHREKLPGTRGKKKGEVKWGVWMTLAALIGFALMQLLGVILLSGDALLPRETFIFSVCMDLMTLFALSELLHRLDIMNEKR